MLIVAEKKSVAQAIAKYLGGRYSAKRLYGVPIYSFVFNNKEATSLGLSGHIMDFDFAARQNVWNRLPPEDLFHSSPLLVIRDEVVKYAIALKTLAVKAKEIYLALDADVEGEAIAYEAAILAKLVNPTARLYRVRFNAVTKRDIENAFRNPGPLDLRQVEKVFTRMQIDLTLGAVFTRFLTLTVRNSLEKGRFLSYGPCQTPVLGLVVARELERINFKPEKYYVLKALVEIEGHKVEMRSESRYKTKAEAQKALALLRRGVVKTAIYRPHRVEPPEPLETVELERRASRWLGINSKKTLDIAEELYRAGYISYPRTETTIYPPTLNLREILQELTAGEHGHYAGQLLRAGFRPTRGDSDDGAHPPIYPTKSATKDEIYRKFGKLGEQAWRIYDFVVRHFLATLSPPALVEKQKIVAAFGPVELIAEGQITLEEGYWAIYPWEREGERPLSRATPGATAAVVKAEILEKETEPPPPMSESELLALMKKYGIGTDATMQDHIATNVKRGYFKLQKGKCIPTPLGMALATSLFKLAPELIEPTVRARIEKQLAGIVKNGHSPKALMAEIKAEFHKYYQVLKARQVELKASLESSLNTNHRAAGGN